MISRRLGYISPVLVLLYLAGCSSSSGTGSTGGSGGGGGGGSTPSISGFVYGGTQPVANATVQLYTVGTSGDGSNATPLMATVTTQTSGAFEITGVSCTNASEVYLTATGGDPMPGVANPDLTLMTALGPCTSLSAGTTVVVNELTTVAAVNALAAYMSSGTAVGSGTSDVASMDAAFTLADELVNPATGTSPGTNVPSGYVVPAAEINTLGDIVAACTNSAGGAAGDGSACGSLFGLTTPPASAAPTNTVGALLDLAKNPGLNAASLFSVVSADSPFQPVLQASPTSFEIAPVAATSSLQITPTNLTFPATLVGATAQAQTVTLLNNGNATVTIGSIALSGTDPAEFAETTTCGASLESNASCTIQVTATPSSIGNVSASLMITSSANGSPAAVALSAVGFPPVSSGTVTTSPNPMYWQIADTLQDVTLSNPGTMPVVITSMQTGTRNFSVTGSTCGSLIQAESICTVTVESTGLGGTDPFTPATYTDTLTIVDSAANSPQTVSLISTNTDGLSVLPPFGTVAVGNSQIAPWGVVYYSDYDGVTYYFSLEGDDPGDFSLSTSSVDDCPDQPCTVNVTFTPQAAGTRTAKISVSPGYLIGYPVGDTYVNVSGVGQAAGPSFVLGTPSFGSAFLAANNIANTTGSVVITNNGTTTISPSSLSITGPAAANFSAASSGCSVLVKLSTCTVNLTFNATALGTYTATLTVTDTVSGIAKTIPLSVQVGYSQVTVQPANKLVGFSNQIVGTVSASQTVTVTDQNGNPLGHGITASITGPFTLPEGSSCPASTTQVCTLSVAFAPQSTGQFDYGLTLTDVISGNTAGVGLRGNAIYAPAVSLSTNSVSFLPLTLGTTSTPMIVTVTNSGAGPLNVSSVQISGAGSGSFSQTNNCSNVVVGGMCSVNITFKPAAMGLQSATVQITSNAPSSPDTISVSGTGQ